MLEDQTVAPAVCVIIATKNRHASLLRAINSLADQTVLPRELVVVDQTDETGGVDQRIRAILPVGVRLKYIWDPLISGLTMARNRGMEHAIGDILLFLDDDVTLYPDFIGNLLVAYGELPDASGISGVPDNYQVPGTFYRIWSSTFMVGPFHDDRQPAYWAAARLNRPIPVSRMTGAMMSFRRADIGETRFDSALRGVSDGEDVDFCIRLRKKYFLYPKCKLTHHFSPVGREKDHWTRRHGRSNAYLYFHNWRRHKWAYAWLCVGLYVAAFCGCMSRLSLAPLRAVRDGIAEGRRCVLVAIKMA